MQARLRLFFPSHHYQHWTRGVDVNKRTATTHSCRLLQGIKFDYFKCSCLFSHSFIGHILAQMKINHVYVYVLDFLVTFLLLATNTALYAGLVWPVEQAGQNQECFFTLLPNSFSGFGAIKRATMANKV